MSNTESINVLIVDDNQNNLFTLRNLINEYIKVQIFEAVSGMTALKILTKQSVDLIILDIQMPEMDGFETAKAIRARKKTQHIPIVFLTAAYKSEEFQQQGYAVGAADYLTKPIDPSQLINRIQTYVRFIEQDRHYKLGLERKVEERTAALKKAHDELEHRVAERTEELLQAKNQAEQAQRFAEQANVTKSQFLANMSHELRTPLNAILGYSEILQEEAEESGQQECISDLQRIYSAGKHLLELINDVLDISKIEAGKMDLSIDTFDLVTVINEVIYEVQPLIEKKANVLTMALGDKLGTMSSDVTKLRQMLLNLLSNAAKFTEQGNISLEVKREQNEWFCFIVTDNGIGMTEEQQKKVFQPFTQADASTTRRFGGTGLGLAITKQFVDMMGGTILLNSEFGKGSTFKLFLPIEIQMAPQEQKKTADKPKKPVLQKMDSTILIIDENAGLRDSLKNDLEKFGYAVALAKTDEEGIALAGKLRPDAIFINQDSSQENCEQILSTLKKNPLLTHIPRIIIAPESAQEKCYALGATHCLDKQAIPHQLDTIVQKYHLDKKSQDFIMIIEDDRVFRDYLTMLFNKQNWQFLLAEHGEIALEYLQKKKPSLIMLDLNMPIMDGFEFIAHLLDNSLWRSIPIVVLTSRTLTSQEQMLLNKYTQAIFQKVEHNRNELVSCIEQLMIEQTSANTQNEVAFQENFEKGILKW
jgi:signal transduction histidine kinase